MKNKTPQFPTQDKDINKDIITWALPAGSIARLGRGCVNDLAISLDKEYLAVGTSIGAWVYKCPTMAPIALWSTERGMVSTLDFFSNRNHRFVAGNADGEIQVWDVQTGTLSVRMKRPVQRTIYGNEQGISQIAVSRDGQYIAASGWRTGVVYIWHAETGEQSAKLSTKPDVALKWSRIRRPLCFSDDGRFLAWASPADIDGTADFIAVWDMRTGGNIVSFKGHTALVHALDFSPCGQFLVSGDMSGILREWDVAAGNEVRVLSEYAEKYRMIPSYSPSGELRAAAVCKTYTSPTFVWDAERNEKLKTFKLPAGLGSIRFSKGTSLAFAHAAEINMWDANTPHTVASISMDISHPGFVTFSPDGQTLLTAGVGPATCWNVVSKKQLKLLSRTATKTPVSTQTRIYSVYISLDGNIEALGACRNMLYVWNLQTHQAIVPCTVHKESVAFAFRPEEQRENLDEKLYVWDKQGSPFTITGHTAHEEYVQAAVFSPTGEKWASGDYDGRLYVWNRHGNPPEALVGHTNSIKALAFAPDGKYLVSASNDGTARIWNVASGEELISLSLTQLDAERYTGDSRHKQELTKQQRERRKRGDKPPRPEIWALAFSPCGDIIAGGLYGEIRLWDARTYEVIRTILPPLTCRRQFALAFSPRGDYLASGAWWDGTEKVSIRLWEVDTGENIATFWGHPTDIQDLAFSPDGALLASGSFDGTILLWDATPYLQNEKS